MWTDKQLNVVIFSAWYDTGGQGYRIKQAFDRYQQAYSVRAIHTMESFFAYPRDLRKGGTEVPQLFANADIIHARNGLEDVSRFRTDLTGVGLVVQHHGTRFREEHARLYPEIREAGAIQVASTIDLTLLEPEVEWLPSPYEPHELMALRTAARPPALKREPGPLRVAHAPTNRLVKSTLAVMAAIIQLNKQGISAQLDLMERLPWDVVLARKAKADVYVDQLKLGYGNNAIEAWAMGVPVVAGVANPAVREAMIEAWGCLPFYEATEATLATRLAELAEDPALAYYWGSIGWNHVVKYHDAQLVSERLASIYAKAMRRTRHGLAQA